jgi:hypothetical protein
MVLFYAIEKIPNFCAAIRQKEYGKHIHRQLYIKEEANGGRN